MTHDWHSPYLRREQDTPGRGSRTARSSWLVSPLASVTVSGHWCSAGSCCIVTVASLLHCCQPQVTGLPSTQSPHRTSGTRPQPRHTRGLLSLLLVSGKRLDLSRGPDVPCCQCGCRVSCPRGDQLSSRQQSTAWYRPAPAAASAGHCSGPGLTITI